MHVPLAVHTTSDTAPKKLPAGTGEGIPALIEELGTQLRPIREFVELSVPHGQSAVIARLHEVAQVTERDYAGEQARFRARIPPHFHDEFAPYIVREIGNGSSSH